MRNNTSTKHVVSERMSLLSQKDLSKQSPPRGVRICRATDKNLCLNEFVHRSEKRTNLPGVARLSRSNAQCQVISTRYPDAFGAVSLLRVKHPRACRCLQTSQPSLHCIV